MLGVFLRLPSFVAETCMVGRSGTLPGHAKCTYLGTLNMSHHVHGSGMAPNATERSQLLGNGDRIGAKDRPETTSARRRPGLASVGCSDLRKRHVEKWILFAGFLITLSFSFTQVP